MRHVLFPTDKMDLRHLLYWVVKISNISRSHSDDNIPYIQRTFNDYNNNDTQKHIDITEKISEGTIIKLNAEK
jgi:hypothetical protein